MAKVGYPYATVGRVGGQGSKGGQTRIRPMLDAVLTARNGSSIQLAVLADSGADAYLFPLDIAKMLGLELERLATDLTRGVGNSENLTYYDTLTIDLGNGIRFETRAGFTEGMNPAGFGLLGQQGFFEKYNVEFRHRERVFTVEAD